MFSELRTIPKRTLIALISLYQATLSPDHGPLKRLYPHGICMFHPTCSEYGKQVIERRGAVVGSLLLFRRLLSCHPWAKPTDEKMGALYKRL